MATNYNGWIEIFVHRYLYIKYFPAHTFINTTYHIDKLLFAAPIVCLQFNGRIHTILQWINIFIRHLMIMKKI